MAGDWEVPGYRHVRDLGCGSTGRVELALDEVSGEPVAIKYLDRRLLADAEFLERFRREAGLMEELSDDNVVRLHRYVESPDGAAIVMEFVEGAALVDVLRTAGPLPAQAALVLLKGSLLGLAAAHTLGIVHRDYKPANVLVDTEGDSRLVDFGIATRQGREDLPAGTPAYMAPEQWCGGRAAPSTDVYAATAVFFECLTGHHPYTGEGPVALRRQHVAAPIPVDQVPGPVRCLIAHGLAKSPEDRPGSAAEFLAELEEAARNRFGALWEVQGRAMLAEAARLTVMATATVPTTHSMLAHTVGASRARHVLRRVARPDRLARLTSHPIALASAVGAVVVAAGAIAAAHTAQLTTNPPKAAARQIAPTTTEGSFPQGSASSTSRSKPQGPTAGANPPATAPAPQSLPTAPAPQNPTGPGAQPLPPKARTPQLVPSTPGPSATPTRTHQSAPSTGTPSPAPPKPRPTTSPSSTTCPWPHLLWHCSDSTRHPGLPLPTQTPPADTPSQAPAPTDPHNQEPVPDSGNGSADQPGSPHTRGDRPTNSNDSSPTTSAPDPGSPDPGAPSAGGSDAGGSNAGGSDAGSPSAGSPNAGGSDAGDSSVGDP